MLTEPRLEERAARPCAAVGARVTMAELGQVLPPLIGRVYGWLGEHGAPPAGPPFFRYVVVDMENELEVEVGIPVAAPVTGEGDVIGGTLPAGTYAVALHTGPPDDVVNGVAELFAWAEKEGVRWARDGERWASRLEILLTDPNEEPDVTKWQTELAFLTE